VSAIVTIFLSPYIYFWQNVWLGSWVLCCLVYATVIAAVLLLWRRDIFQHDFEDNSRTKNRALILALASKATGYDLIALAFGWLFFQFWFLLLTTVVLENFVVHHTPWIKKIQLAFNAQCKNDLLTLHYLLTLLSCLSLRLANAGLCLDKKFWEFQDFVLAKIVKYFDSS